MRSILGGKMRFISHKCLGLSQPSCRIDICLFPVIRTLLQPPQPFRDSLATTSASSLSPWVHPIQSPDMCRCPFYINCPQLYIFLTAWDSKESKENKIPIITEHHTHHFVRIRPYLWAPQSIHPSMHVCIVFASSPFFLAILPSFSALHCLS